MWSAGAASFLAIAPSVLVWLEIPDDSFPFLMTYNFTKNKIEYVYINTVLIKHWKTGFQFPLSPIPYVCTLWNKPCFLNI